MPHSSAHHLKAVTRVEHVSGPRETCAHCGHAIVWGPEVGWFDPRRGTSYDICPGDRYGNHVPVSHPRVAARRALVAPRHFQPEPPGPS